MQCTVYCIIYIVCCVSVYCASYTLYCVLRSVYCVLYAVYCILYVACCVVYTVYCMLCVVYLCLSEESNFKIWAQTQTVKFSFTKQCILIHSRSGEGQASQGPKLRLLNPVGLLNLGPTDLRAPWLRISSGPSDGRSLLGYNNSPPKIHSLRLINPFAPVNKSRPSGGQSKM